MAGWTIVGGNGAKIDSTGLATFQPNTGTTDIIYTITYTDENGNCGSTTIRQPGGCSGGGGDTCEGITISGNVNTPDGETFTNGGTLEIGGGTLYFTHSEPAPPPVPTGCDGVDWGYQWRQNYPAGSQKEIDYCESLLHQAAQCTKPAAEGTNNGVITNHGDYWVMVKIKNETLDYLPYDGGFYLMDVVCPGNCCNPSEGCTITKNKILLQYRDYTVSYNEYPHHYTYGALPNQPSNLFINPTGSTEWLKCKITDPNFIGQEIVGETDAKIKFRPAYSSLNDKSGIKKGEYVYGNLRLHRDMYYYPGMTITFEKGDASTDLDPNSGGKVYLRNHMKITLKVTSVGESHHSFTQEEYDRGWHLYVESDGSLNQLTPVDLYGK